VFRTRSGYARFGRHCGTLAHASEAIPVVTSLDQSLVATPVKE
jgi:hypothetical protein